MILWHPDSPGSRIDVNPNWWHRLVGPVARDGSLRFATLSETSRYYKKLGY